MHIKLLYFARLREVFALDRESLDLPEGSRVTDLLDLLRARGEPWTTELSAGRSFRVAVNQDLAEAQLSLKEADEVALFPPVTGG